LNSKDIFNFLQKLTLQKVTNALAVLASFYVSKYTRKPLQWGLPFTVSIEPTTSCNLGCPECPSGIKSFTRPTGNLNFDLYKKMIDELSPHTLYCYFYFQGEPYIHPKFTELVKQASLKKIYTVTSTNAHYLTERKAIETVQSGLDRIIISMDGTTQEVYEQYRVGGSLQKVIEGTKNLVAAKQQLKSSTPHIIIQFLVVKPNEHQIEEVKQLGKQLGVDEVKLKTAQVYDYENGNPLIPDSNEFSRYKKQANGTYKVKSSMENYCWKLWHSTVITWDGKVVPCCFDKDAEHQMGNIADENFATVWQGSNYNSFRANVLKSRKSINICANCSEGLKVWA
jgi:radical SAM protein with 4Fe4S-binding SPASM domain